MSTRKETLKRIENLRFQAYRYRMEVPKVSLSKMKKEELEAYTNDLETKVIIANIVDDAEYRDRSLEKKPTVILAKALIEKFQLKAMDLQYWKWDNFIVNTHPAEEFISASCRASVWTQTADASIDLNGNVYEVTNVNVYSEAHGL